MKIRNILLFSLVFIIILIGFIPVNANGDISKSDYQYIGIDGYGLPNTEGLITFNKGYYPFQDKKLIDYIIPISTTNEFGLNTVIGLKFFLSLEKYFEEENSGEKILIPLSEKIVLQYEIDKFKNIIEINDITPLDKIIKNGNMILFNSKITN